MAYADVVYATLSVTVTKLLSPMRRKERITRFRAKSRVMHHMASAVVYSRKTVPNQDARPVSDRSSTKTEAVKEDIKLRRKKRKGDWKKQKEEKHGAGTFGHGRDSPGP